MRTQLIHRYCAHAVNAIYCSAFSSSFSFSRDIQQLLSIVFSHTDPHPVSSVDSKGMYMYLILVARDPSESLQWTGRTVRIKALADATIATSEMKVGGEGGAGK